jgi:hypothetical protein
MVTPNPEHPEDLNPDTAGIRVPRRVSNLPGESKSAADAFQDRMNEYRVGSQETPPPGESVPVDALNDLLDDQRMRDRMGPPSLPPHGC